MPDEIERIDGGPPLEEVLAGLPPEAFAATMAAYFEEPEMGSVSELGADLHDLWEGIGDWSDRVFGPGDGMRCLNHLAEDEIDEARRELEQVRTGDPEAVARLQVETADMLLLLLDFARRNGLSPAGLLREALRKLEINQNRQWPDPTGTDEPVHHLE